MNPNTPIPISLLADILNSYILFSAVDLTITVTEIVDWKLDLPPSQAHSEQEETMAP
jgi:hypothetical protein